MAKDTKFEKSMDDYVANNMEVLRRIERQDDASERWINVPTTSNLNENTKYRLLVRARNNGSETAVKNVQIRVVNENKKRIQFYKDDSYTDSDTGHVTRKDSLKYPDELRPGETTPEHMVHFKVLEGPDREDARIARYGLYLEIVPEAHDWKNITWDLD